MKIDIKKVLLGAAMVGFLGIVSYQLFNPYMINKRVNKTVDNSAYGNSFMQGKRLGRKFSAGITQLPRIRVDPVERVMRDEYGSQVVFHGVNVVYKEKPYLPNLDDFHP